MPEIDEPNDDEILRLYQWAPGSCFNCARTGVETTHLADAKLAGDGAIPVRACKGCVLELEAMSRQAAKRNGERYEPGRLGRTAA